MLKLDLKVNIGLGFDCIEIYCTNMNGLKGLVLYTAYLKHIVMYSIIKYTRSLGYLV